MNWRLPIVLALISLCCLSSFGQKKVKYKDLYYLLSSKKYDQAEPFLKQFLAEEKNVDHPNANFQMAVIYEIKAEEADIFQESDLAWIYSDSSIHFYGLAKQYIDEKEVRKNDDYYEDFAKRDMRTGKLEVEAFDIHFAIDEKVEAIKNRQQKVAEVNDKLLDVITAYNNSRRYFINFKTNSKHLNELLLRANLKTIGALDRLADTYDSFQLGFTQMKELLEEIPNSGYSQQVRPKSIESFEEDGESESHFLDDDIMVWNYSEWAKKTKVTVLTEVLPMKNELVEHDRKLEDLLEKAQGDSAVFGPQLNSLRSAFSGEILRKYDQDPLPLKLFNLRYAELDYFNRMLVNKDFNGSSDYGNRLRLLEGEIELIQKMDSVVEKIIKLNIDEQIRNYTDFVESRYDGYLGLDKFLKNKLEASKAYITRTQEKIERIRERNSYVIANQQNYFIDSLYFEQARDTLNYELLFTNDHFSGGYLEGEDGKSGYVVEVNPQRVTNIFYEISLDSAQLGDSPQLIGETDPSGQVFYLLFYGDTLHVPVDTEFAEVEYQEPDSATVSSDSTTVQTDTHESSSSNGPPDSIGEGVAEGFKVVHPALLAKIYRVDGISWMVPLNLRDQPVRLRLNDLGEIIIDEQSEEGGRAMSMLIISNKDGSVKSD